MIATTLPPTNNLLLLGRPGFAFLQLNFHKQLRVILCFLLGTNATRLFWYLLVSWEVRRKSRVKIQKVKICSSSSTTLLVPTLTGVMKITAVPTKTMIITQALVTIMTRNLAHFTIDEGPLPPQISGLTAGQTLSWKTKIWTPSQLHQQRMSHNC